MLLIGSLEELLERWGTCRTGLLLISMSALDPCNASDGAKKHLDFRHRDDIPIDRMNGDVCEFALSMVNFPPHAHGLFPIASCP